MTYVLYNTQTEYQVGTFQTERGAKISRAAFYKRGQYVDKLSIMEYSEFQEKFNGYVTVKNYLSGKEVQIRKQDVGSCCDPSTERYWSM